MEYISNSAEDTLKIAQALAKKLKKGDIVLLNGRLGAGKTVFTKGIAVAFGVEEVVTSPTYLLVKEYHGGKLPLYHFDLYRVSNPDELFELGLEDYLQGDGVCVIEWNSFTDLPIRPYVVDIEVTGDTARRITVTAPND